MIFLCTIDLRRGWRGERRQSNASHARPAVGGVRADRETMVTEIADGWTGSLSLCVALAVAVF